MRLTTCNIRRHRCQVCDPADRFVKFGYISCKVWIQKKRIQNEKYDKLYIVYEFCLNEFPVGSPAPSVRHIHASLAGNSPERIRNLSERFLITI